MRRRLGQVAAMLVAVLVGSLVATTLNDALGISFSEKDLPDQAGFDVGDIAAPAAFEPVGAVVVPEQDEWLGRAAEHVAEALENRTGQRPELTTSTSAGRSIDTRIDEQDAEGFRIEAAGGGLTVVAGERTMLVRGYYWLADRIATGAAETDLLGEHQDALPLRMVDLGGLGVPADATHWDPTNYSHNSRRFGQAIGYQEPYVDADAWAGIEADFTDYVDRMLAYGNNALVAGGFLNLITFDGVGEGTEVYGPDSPYRARHQAIGQHRNQLWQIADDAGMDVYLSHTELALTPPLEEYLTETNGHLDTEDPATWEVYQQGLAELFEKYPAVDGMMIRVGEAGEIYDPQSEMRYSTRLDVDTDESVQQMLAAFLEVAEEYGKDIIFRSWTVGIGEVGDMHTSSETYHRVLDEIDSEHLIVSTKYAEGDFYRFLPFNETLYTGDHRRIIEMQGRLEYEGFMAFPDLVAGLHSASLRSFVDANEHIDGVWHWTQNGGPQQAGPLSLYPFAGFWLNIDANVYTTSRIATDPSIEPAEAAADWVRRRFGSDPGVVEPLTQMLALSGVAAAKGLYISAFANQQVLALGLEPPPMMWIFEWDIVSGSSSVLSVVYHLSRDQVDAMVAEGQEAVALAEQMRALVDQVDPGDVHDPALLAQLGESIDYEISLLQTLAAWRATALRYYQWLDTGSAEAGDAWHEARAEFQDARTEHLAAYAGDVDFPAYNFFAADRGVAHMDRDQAMAWLARGLLLVFLAGATVVLLLRWRSWWITPATAVWLVLSFGTFSSFLSWHLPVLLSMMTLMLLSVLMALNRRVAGEVTRVVLLRLAVVGAVFLGVTAVRGPGLFWLQFWTGPVVRSVLVVVIVTLLLWTLAGAWCVILRSRSGTVHRPVSGSVWSSGSLLAALGAVLVAVGAVPAIAGLETMLTGLNNEMAILPMGLSLILGITTHLGIPDSLPVTIMLAGGVLVVAGALAMAGSAWRRLLARRSPVSNSTQV